MMKNKTLISFFKENFDVKVKLTRWFVDPNFLSRAAYLVHPPCLLGKWHSDLFNFDKMIDMEVESTK